VLISRLNLGFSSLFSFAYCPLQYRNKKSFGKGKVVKDETEFI
jgi:hypothetical protein